MAASFLAVAALAAVVPRAVLQAQDQTLRGIVIDDAGVPLEAAIVQIEDGPGSVLGSVETDEAGEFSVPGLASGSYRVTVERGGFVRFTRQIRVPTRTDAPLRIVLQPALLSSESPATDERPNTRGGPRGTPASESDDRVVEVFYATDRAPTRTPGVFTSRRRSGDGLSYGSIEVSIPPEDQHQLAGVERPRWLKFWGRENRDRYFVIINRRRLPRDGFFGEVGAAVDRSTRKEAFIFIHGFNVSFDKSVYRTAQIAHDLGFEGAPILYSWPTRELFSSIGSVFPRLTYYQSMDENDKSSLILRGFLGDVASRSGADIVHVIAHSMGNRALVNALDGMATGDRPSFNQIVLTAPDIDAVRFRQLAAKVKSHAERVTLYVSSEDEALQASTGLHDYRRRAGDSEGDEVLVVDGIDTVDASAAKTDMLGHSNSPQIILDILHMFRDRTPPEERSLLKRAPNAGGNYWELLAQQ